MVAGGLPNEKPVAPPELAVVLPLPPLKRLPEEPAVPKRPLEEVPEVGWLDIIA